MPFTADRTLTGELVNQRVTTVVTCAVAGLIICLNGFLLVQSSGLA